MKFIKEKKQYVIEKDDVVNNLPIDEVELDEHFQGKTNMWLAHFSNQTYDLMFDAHVRERRQEHNECIRWKIYKHKYAREMFKEACLEVVMGSIISGSDLMQYVENKEHWPPSVLRKLHNAELLIKGNLTCNPEWLE